MEIDVTGTFSVDLVPQPHRDGVGDAAIARMSLDKRFEGGVSGRSLGEMLSAGDPSSGHAGYVAIERVEGSIDGRTGAFCLQHIGVMGPQRRLEILVVPGSGEGDLTGIGGSMELEIVDGTHHYRLRATLPD